MLKKRIIVAIILLIAVLQLLISFRYYWYLCNYGQLNLTTGSEELNVYALWKVINHYPLYESTTSMPYALTPYNAGFYRFYGLILGGLGVTGSGLYTVGRIITTLFAVWGTYAFPKCVASILNRPPNGFRLTERAMLLGIGFILFFGSNFSAVWSATVRPDIPALALATVAISRFYMWLHRGDRGSRKNLVIASLFFSIAWLFKQSFVSLYVGCLAIVIITTVRAWALSKGLIHTQNIAAFVIPMAISILIPCALESKHYLDNIVIAQSINPLVPSLFINYIPHIGASAFLIFLGIFAWKQFATDNARIVLPIATQLVVAIPFNVYTSIRDGSSRNHLFESYLMCTLVSTIVILYTIGYSARAGHQLNVALLFLFPTLSVTLMHLIAPNHLGTQIPVTRSLYEQRLKQLEYFQTLPKPTITNDPVFSLPWFSNGNEHPTYIHLDIYFDRAESMKRLDSNYFDSTFDSAPSIYLQSGTPQLNRITNARIRYETRQAISPIFEVNYTTVLK